MHELTKISPLPTLKSMELKKIVFFLHLTLGFFLSGWAAPTSLDELVGTYSVTSAISENPLTLTIDEDGDVTLIADSPPTYCRGSSLFHSNAHLIMELNCRQEEDPFPLTWDLDFSFAEGDDLSQIPGIVTIIYDGQPFKSSDFFTFKRIDPQNY
ncbi:MAG: hypothetical protein OXB88_04660 [Bacteriovoracales bacterium]|nr:hypothetical protein [Bacteriovoracales bacterium]